jgi:hypothetical protein
MGEPMIIEPFGHKCLRCGEEITGMCVMFRRVNPETPYLVLAFTHPECFVGCVIIPDKDPTNDNNAEMIEHRYVLYYHYSYYGMLS